MIASLPMYDFPWVRAATDRFWTTLRDRLRARGIAAPEALERKRDIAGVWSDSGLILGQTCGYPLWTQLRRKVELLATPIYGFSGCEGASHRSFLLAHRDDPRETLAEFRGDRAAVNSGDSNTGMNLFRAEVAPLAGGKPFFADVVETGGHALSVVAIVEKRADIAAVDCVTYALLARGASQLVAQTENHRRNPDHPRPALHRQPRPAARDARRGARRPLRDLPPFPELGLTAVAFLPETAYACVAEIEQAAVEAGYPRLA